MPSSLNAQWSLFSAASRHLIVPWYDPLAKDAHRRLSAFAATHMLERWLASHRLTLQKIDESLEGERPVPSSFARGPYTEALKKRLADAFQRGVLVALEAPSTPSTAVDGSRVTLTLEWASDVVEQLSQDVWILVSKDNTVIQRFPLSTAHREDGLARLSAGEWGSQETLTVVAQRGDTKLVLLRNQRAGDLAGKLVWEHSLEELLTARDEPSPSIHSSIRRAPEDTRAERDSGDIQEI